MRILFAGTPQAAVPALEALYSSDHDVVAVLTRPDARQGRGRTLVPSPVKKRAIELGLDVMTDSPDDPDFLGKLAQLRIDVAAVVAYGKILRQPVLDALPYGWINLHFSLLPAWRGAAPVQRAIIAGDEFTGASTFVIEPELDSGPVIAVMTQRIGPRDTAGELLMSLADGGADLLVKTMDVIASGQCVPQPQSGENISYAPKLQVAEGLVPWHQPAMYIDRLIRGFTPNPGAWTTLADGSRLGLGPIRIVSQDESVPSDLGPGELFITKRAVYVGTATQVVELGLVKPQGKKMMSAADWARGARLESRSTLGETA